MGPDTAHEETMVKEAVDCWAELVQAAAGWQMKG